MGVWGPGLYANDFAVDLRAAIRTIVRLPFEADRLVEILCESEPGASKQVEDEDYDTFWLVAADQFHKHGLDADRAFRKARQIIDSQKDIERLAGEGMSERELRKRSENLTALRKQLDAEVPNRKRSTIRNPQPFLCELGDLLLFPLSASGEPINPYLSKSRHDATEWEHNYWGAACVVHRGRAFDFLAWYQVTKLAASELSNQRPTTEQLERATWQLANPGTLSPSHFRKLGLEVVDRLNLVPDMVAERLAIEDGLPYALNDVSICNSLSISVHDDSPKVLGLLGFIQP